MTDDRQAAPLRAAIVGAGLMGRWHADAISRLGHTVAAIIDSDRDRAAKLARMHGNAATLDSLRSSSGQFDVVHVCTPLDSHRAVVEAALEQGWHVIVEKPLAPNAADAQEMLRKAVARERLLVPVHQFLFQRGVAEAIERLPSIGPVLHFEATACTAGADGRSDSARDRVAIDILPHPLSLISRLISPDITECGWRVRRPRPGEMRADGMLAGATLSLLVSTRGRPTTNTVRVICEGGTIHLDLFHGFAVHTHGRPSRMDKIMQPFLAGTSALASATGNLARRAVEREPAYPGLRELIRQSYAAIRGRGPSPISADETLRVATACDQIVGEMGRL